MKLYTFLLIDDELVNDSKLFKVSDEKIIKETKKRKDKGNAPSYFKSNRIYTYQENSSIVFMRFRYPNVDISLDPYERKYNWAYVLIDNEPDKEAKFLKQIWGTNVDKKGERQENEYFSSPDGSIKLKKVQRVRTGGHIGNTKHRLHEFVYFGREENDLQLKTEHIHHKGHSFDNRRKYLERVKLSKHRQIHNNWEHANDYCRPYYNQFGDVFIDNDCKGIDRTLNKEEQNGKCRSCSAVLRIETEDMLKNFIGELTGKDYMGLEMGR